MVDFASRVAKEGERPRADFASRLKATEDESMAQFVGQQELGEPGLKSPLGRFAIAQGDTTGEKIVAFKKAFPNGDLSRDPTGEFLFREDPSQPYRKVEGPGFEPVLDLIDFLAADTGAIMGEVLLTAGTRGVSLVPLLARIFVGGTAGDLAQQGAQESLGANVEGLPEIASRSAVKGVISTGLGGLGGALASGLDKVTGGGIVGKAQDLPGAEESSRIIESSTGIEQANLTLGQSSSSPIIKKIEGQSGAAFAAVQNHLDLQQRNLIQAFKTLRSSGRNAQFLSTPLEQTLNKETRNLVSQLKVKGASFGKAGESLQQGLENYKAVSGLVVDEAYDAARRIEEPVFNLDGLREASRKSILGVPGKDAAGEVIQLSDEIPGELVELVKDIQNWDPSALVFIDDQPVPVTEQLRALQRRAAELMQPPAGRLARTPANARAAQVWGAISDTLKSPANKSPEFTKAWSNANKFASLRFTTLERAAFVKGVKSQTPTNLAKELAQPFRVDDINFYRSVVPNEEFKLFQDAFKSDLARNPSEIINRMEKFDKETMAALLSPDDKRLFFETGIELNKLKDIKIQEALDRQAKVGGMIDELILKRKDTARIAKLQEIVAKNGGAKGPLGAQIRAGIIDSIIDKSVRQQSTAIKEEVSGNVVRKILLEIEESGADAFLLPEDVTLLKAFGDLGSFLKPTSDTGTSIAGGEAADTARGLAAGGFTIDGARSLMEMAGFGNLVVNPKARAFLIGGRNQNLTFRKYMTLMSAISGDIATTASQQEQLKKIESSLQ